MSDGEYPKFFERLVNAYRHQDESEMQICKDLLGTSGKQLRVEILEDVEWEESVSDQYEECPLVTQIFKVYLGDELLYEGHRLFGSEIVDPTHTGLGGRWLPIQVDMGDEDAVVDALEDLGIEIESPDVPAWR